MTADHEHRGEDDTATPNADAELVLRSRSGDDEAFGELWRRHYRSGIVAARAISSSVEPDDLVQEAYTRILQAVQRGGGPTGAFRSYLFSTIRNVAASWGRAPVHTPTDALAELVDPDSTAEATDDALDRSLTHTAFRSLPTRWQEVLWYTEIEQMKPGEIAPLLGMKAAAVSQLAFRAREGLREAWIQAHLASAAEGSEHAWVIGKLGAYTRGNLGARDRERLKDHLVECARCTIVASEAHDVGGRLALVLLPLVLGATGAGSYLAALQRGDEVLVALAAIPSSVYEGAVVAGGSAVAGASGAVAGDAGAAGAGAGGAEIGAAATGASGAGAAPGHAAATGTAWTTIAGLVGAGAAALAVAGVVIAGTLSGSFNGGAGGAASAFGDSSQDAEISASDELLAEEDEADLLPPLDDQATPTPTGSPGPSASPGPDSSPSPSSSPEAQPTPLPDEVPDPSPTPGPESPAPLPPAPEPSTEPESPAPEEPAPETPAPETPNPETPAPEEPAPDPEPPVDPTPEPGPIAEPIGIGSASVVDPAARTVQLAISGEPGEAVGVSALVPAPGSESLLLLEAANASPPLAETTFGDDGVAEAAFSLSADQVRADAIIEVGYLEADGNSATASLSGLGIHDELLDALDPGPLPEPTPSPEPTADPTPEPTSTPSTTPTPPSPSAEPTPTPTSTTPPPPSPTTTPPNPSTAPVTIIESSGTADKAAGTVAFTVRGEAGRNVQALVGDSSASDASTLGDDGRASLTVPFTAAQLEDDPQITVRYVGDNGQGVRTRLSNLIDLDAIRIDDPFTLRVLELDDTTKRVTLAATGEAGMTANVALTTAGGEAAEPVAEVRFDARTGRAEFEFIPTMADLEATGSGLHIAYVASHATGDAGFATLSSLDLPAALLDEDIEIGDAAEVAGSDLVDVSVTGEPGTTAEVLLGSQPLAPLVFDDQGVGAVQLDPRWTDMTPQMPLVIEYAAPPAVYGHGASRTLAELRADLLLVRDQLRLVPEATELSATPDRLLSATVHVTGQPGAEARLLLDGAPVGGPFTFADDGSSTVEIIRSPEQATQDAQLTPEYTQTSFDPPVDPVSLTELGVPLILPAEPPTLSNASWHAVTPDSSEGYLSFTLAASGLVDVLIDGESIGPAQLDTPALDTGVYRSARPDRIEARYLHDFGFGQLIGPLSPPAPIADAEIPDDPL
jgi:RNA polymerase sigma factor (sigma-70 family)